MSVTITMTIGFVSNLVYVSRLLSIIPCGICPYALNRQQQLSLQKQQATVWSGAQTTTHALQQRQHALWQLNQLRHANEWSNQMNRANNRQAALDSFYLQQMQEQNALSRSKHETWRQNLADQWQRQTAMNAQAFGDTWIR